MLTERANASAICFWSSSLMRADSSKRDATARGLRDPRDSVTGVAEGRRCGVRRQVTVQGVCSDAVSQKAGNHGVPGSLVGGSEGKCRPTMSADILVRGDHLPALNELAVNQTEATASPRALVWGIDLGECSTRLAVKRQLRHAFDDVVRIARSDNRLVHLFLPYSHRGAMPQGSCLSSAARLAAKLHAALERELGRDVDVVAIDITGCENGELLRDRIANTVSAPAGPAGDMALAWPELTRQSIRSAALQQQL